MEMHARWKCSHEMCSSKCYLHCRKLLEAFEHERQNLESKLEAMSRTTLKMLKTLRITLMSGYVLKFTDKGKSQQALIKIVSDLCMFVAHCLHLREGVREGMDEQWRRCKTMISEDILPTLSKEESPPTKDGCTKCQQGSLQLLDQVAGDVYKFFKDFIDDEYLTISFHKSEQLVSGWIRSIDGEGTEQPPAWYHLAETFDLV